jgi:hypothetical protein
LQLRQKACKWLISNTNLFETTNYKLKHYAKSNKEAGTLSEQDRQCTLSHLGAFTKPLYSGEVLTCVCVCVCSPPHMSKKFFRVPIGILKRKQGLGIFDNYHHLAPTGIRSPDCLARSESLYRLRYPARSLD